jgi:hypothetical protein
MMSGLLLRMVLSVCLHLLIPQYGYLVFIIFIIIMLIEEFFRRIIYFLCPFWSKMLPVSSGRYRY